MSVSSAKVHCCSALEQQKCGTVETCLGDAVTPALNVYCDVGAQLFGVYVDLDFFWSAKECNLARHQRASKIRLTLASKIRPLDILNELLRRRSMFVAAVICRSPGRGDFLNMFIIIEFCSYFVGRTLHTCSDVCVEVSIWHGEVLCAVCGSTTKPSDPARHASPCCHLGHAHSLIFVRPVPSLLCACLVATDPPPGVGYPLVLGFLCLWAVLTATGLVPLTTVGFTRELWWCWWPVPRWWNSSSVTTEPGVLSQRCTTLAFGQGSYAVFLGA